VVEFCFGIGVVSLPVGHSLRSYFPFLTLRNLCYKNLFMLEGVELYRMVCYGWRKRGRYGVWVKGNSLGRRVYM
jgi:hypothetical protein